MTCEKREYYLPLCHHFSPPNLRYSKKKSTCSYEQLVAGQLKVDTHPQSIFPSRGREVKVVKDVGHRTHIHIHSLSLSFSLTGSPSHSTNRQHSTQLSAEDEERNTPTCSRKFNIWRRPTLSAGETALK